MKQRRARSSGAEWPHHHLIGEVRSQDPELRRKGRILAVMLLGVTAAMLALTTFNIVQGDSQYNLTNGTLIALAVALFTLNRLGYVRFTSVATVAATSVVPFLLIDASLVGTYVTMVLPILVASSLLAPWSGLVIVALMIAGAALYGIASLSLLILVVVTVFAYLFANSIDRAYRENRHQALHDALTGLPNRTLFVDRLQQAIDRFGRDAKPCAVLFLDLDQFKVVNDSLGHEAGDELLVRAARRLLTQLRPGDTAARLGGDEFAVLLDDIAGPEDAIRVAERIGEGIQLPVEIQERQIVVSTSIGIALTERADEQPDILLRNADVAMYEAKRAGKARYEVFNPGMYTQALRRMELENDLRRAIEREELTLHYQPILMLRTNRIVGVEALVRWNDGERGLISPDEFIPLAEETGLIVPLGRWVFREACRQAGEWVEKYPTNPPLIVSVNLSVKQFQEPRLTQELVACLQETGLEPRSLQLEITESVVARDVEHAVGMLQELKDLGIRLAIDDFGTGYSSLSTLQRFPLDAIKIDKRFINGFGKDERDTAIARLIVDLAHSLGMQAIAEGVETSGQLSMLRKMGCDEAQGFFFWEALAGAEAEPLLGDSPP